MTSYRFGVKPIFELQVRERRLFADGEAVHLGSRALDVLVVLVERAGQGDQLQRVLRVLFEPGVVGVQRSLLWDQLSGLELRSRYVRGA